MDMELFEAPVQKTISMLFSISYLIEFFSLEYIYILNLHDLYVVLSYT